MSNRKVLKGASFKNIFNILFQKKKEIVRNKLWHYFVSWFKVCLAILLGKWFHFIIFFSQDLFLFKCIFVLSWNFLLNVKEEEKNKNLKTISSNKFFEGKARKVWGGLSCCCLLIVLNFNEFESILSILFGKQLYYIENSLSFSSFFCCGKNVQTFSWNNSHKKNQKIKVGRKSTEKMKANKAH